jgi:peptidoglycan/xylan/chitin deacetylase (PgdA/CDA1 family)
VTSAAVAALTAVLLAGCSSPLVARISSDPSTAPGRPAKLPPTAVPTVPAAPTPTTTPSDEPAVIAPSPGVTLPQTDPGLVPVLHRIPTTDPVVFITIDDGYDKDPAVVALLTARHVPVTPFLAVTALATHHEYFDSVQNATGQHVQDHTLTHPFLSRYSYARQKHEICGAADQLGTWYGTRPWLFRPPYGDYSTTTRRAAKDCGMTAIVLWDVSLPHRVLRYAEGSRLRPGDIILIHWRPGLARDLPVAIDAIEAAGLRAGALQDYLPAP